MYGIYKILWIDDQYEAISELMERCEEEFGFEITKCRFAKEGMQLFEQNLDKWSAVILDAKVLMESFNEVPSLNGLTYCRDRINVLRAKKYVPMYVFTGQPDLLTAEMFKSMVGGTFYSKGDDDDQLIDDVIREADKQLDTQIRKKYQDALRVYPEIETEVVKILRVLEDPKESTTFNDIRKVLEFIFDTFYKKGIIETEFKGTNLSECSHNLCDKSMRGIVPEYVQRSFHLCCAVSNEGSHRNELDERERTNMAPYVLKSTIYCLLNILQWCNNLPSAETVSQARRKYQKQKNQKD